MIENITYKVGEKEYLIVLYYDEYEVAAGIKKRQEGVIPVLIQRFIPEVNQAYTIYSAITEQFKNNIQDWKYSLVLDFEYYLLIELKRKCQLNQN